MEVEMNLTVLYEVKSFYIMLDVNNVLPTLYKDRKMKIINVSKTTTKTKTKTKTKDENGVDRKEQ
jgi:3-methyladenine DNA glycosylase AlkC